MISTTPPRLRWAGDSAALLEFAPRIDERINERAIAVASALRGANLPGVRDVFSTYRSVAVLFDPLLFDTETLSAALGSVIESPLAMATHRVVDVPVVYGGPEGPDLLELAKGLGCHPREIVERHVGATYRVYMMGFLPGFGYLGELDPALRVPRRASPRPSVPGGTVGVAGSQTGIYPVASPGGWQLIGRTPLTVFDPQRDPAALLEAGDRVRFYPVPSGSSLPSGIHANVREAHGPRPNEAGPPVATVVRAGLCTSIQDGGRWGHQHLGLSVSGAMDSASSACANAALGNSFDAAVLEITLLGPELRFEGSCGVAVSGADLSATIDGREMPLGRAVKVDAGSVLRFGDRRDGARAYLAIEGGVAVPRVMGSRSTHLRAGLGGHHGRPLAAGDCVWRGTDTTSARESQTRPRTVGPEGGACLRLIPGPQDDYFPGEAYYALERARFRVSPRSDRMGYRLEGEKIPIQQGVGEMISDATLPGGVQVPPSGEPILLLADRPTTGGYPQVGVIATVDLPRAGQLAPGDWVEFSLCDRDDAIRALRAEG